MDGREDGWMGDGWMDDGWIGGWMDGRTYFTYCIANNL